MHSSRKQVNPFTPTFHYCPLHNYYDSSLENLVLDQLLISQLTFLFILITCLLDIVLILSEEILSRSLMGVKGLLLFTYHTSVGELAVTLATNSSTNENIVHRNLTCLNLGM